MDTLKQELTSLEKELAEIYASVAKSYKPMIKINDSYRLDLMQSMIDLKVSEAGCIREKIERVSKEIMDAWNSLDTKPRF